MNYNAGASLVASSSSAFHHVNSTPTRVTVNAQIRVDLHLHLTKSAAGASVHPSTAHPLRSWTYSPVAVNAQYMLCLAFLESLIPGRVDVSPLHASDPVQVAGSWTVEYVNVSLGGVLMNSLSHEVVKSSSTQRWEFEQGALIFTCCTVIITRTLTCHVTLLLHLVSLLRVTPQCIACV